MTVHESGRWLGVTHPRAIRVSTTASSSAGKGATGTWVSTRLLCVYVPNWSISRL